MTIEYKGVNTYSTGMSEHIDLYEFVRIALPHDEDADFLAECEKRLKGKVLTFISNNTNKRFKIKTIATPCLVFESTEWDEEWFFYLSAPKKEYHDD